MYNGSNGYDRLFSPLQVGTHTLPNRLVQGALSSGFHVNNRVSERHLTFYEARARAGTAMIITESLAAHRTLPPGKRIIVTDDADFAGLQRWAACVERHNVRLIGQFVDPGRGRHQPGRTLSAIGASALPDDLSWTVPRPLERDEITRIVDDFATSAARLQRAGFSGVELSCGHGHLLHQFLSPQANKRTDAYGGNVENRTRFIREIAGAIRTMCGAGFVIGLKLPGDDGVPGGVSGDVASETVARLAMDGLADYFAIAQGAHHPMSLDMHIPDYTYPAMPYEAITRAMRKAAGGVPVLAVGSIHAPAEAEHLLAVEAADGIMMARAFLADPEWALKARLGQSASIRPCISCNGCWEETFQGRAMSCVMNPAAGMREELSPPVPVQAAKEIAVIGGGPAGLEAAIASARRGHRVTLFSSSMDLGGGLRLHANIPGCERLKLGLSHKIREAHELGINLRCGQTVTPEMLLARKAHAIILACGARMLRPVPEMPELTDLRSLLPQYLAMEDDHLPRQLVIYDQDHTIGTYDAIRYLAARGIQITVATPREALASDVNLATRLRVFRDMALHQVRVLPFTRLISIGNGTVALENIYNGERHAFSEGTALSYSTPRIPDMSLRNTLRSMDMPVYLAGDILAPATLMSAMRSGHAAALAV